MDTCLYVFEGMKRAHRSRLRDGARGARPTRRRLCPGAPYTFFSEGAPNTFASTLHPTPFALDHSS